MALPALIAPGDQRTLVVSLGTLVVVEVAITVWRDGGNRRERERAARALQWVGGGGREPRFPGDLETLTGYDWRILERGRAADALADLAAALDAICQARTAAGLDARVAFTPRPEMPQLPPVDAREVDADDELGPQRRRLEKSWRRRRELAEIEDALAFAWLAYGAGVLGARASRLRREAASERSLLAFYRDMRAERIEAALRAVAPVLEGVPVPHVPFALHEATLEARRNTRAAAITRYLDELTLLDAERALIEAKLVPFGAQYDPTERGPRQPRRLRENLGRLASRREYTQSRLVNKRRTVRDYGHHHLGEAGRRLVGRSAYLGDRADQLDVESLGLVKVAFKAARSARKLLSWSGGAPAPALAMGLARESPAGLPSPDAVHALRAAVAEVQRWLDVTMPSTEPEAKLRTSIAMTLATLGNVSNALDDRLRYAGELRLRAAVLAVAGGFGRFTEAELGPLRHQRRSTRGRD